MFIFLGFTGNHLHISVYTFHVGYDGCTNVKNVSIGCIVVSNYSLVLGLWAGFVGWRSFICWPMFPMVIIVGF